MGENEKRRSIVLRRVARGSLTLEQATRVLNLSYRHLKRVWKRFRDEGTVGLAHRSKGRPSNRAFHDGFREQILVLYREQPPGTGPTRFAAILARQGIAVDHETLRRWLIDRGAWKPSRSRAMPRQPGPEAHGFGELLTLVSLYDGWLGPERPQSFLLVLHDEATSRILCSLAAEDSCEPVLRLLAGWIDRHGLPAALRCPRRSPGMDPPRTLPAAAAGSVAFGATLSRACERLGVELETLSPVQARAWREGRRDLLTMLRRELVHGAAAGVDEATSLLLGPTGDFLNHRFASGTAAVENYHVKIVDGTDLRRILCVDRLCRVGPGGVVSDGRHDFRLSTGAASAGALPSSVVVSEWLDGSIHIANAGTELPFIVEPGGSRPRLAI